MDERSNTNNSCVLRKGCLLPVRVPKLPKMSSTCSFRYREPQSTFAAIRALLDTL